MPDLTTKTGATIFATVAALTVALAITISVMSMGRFSAVLEPPSTAELNRTLRRVRLDPESLAAAGATATQAASVVAAMRGHLEDAIDRLRAADAALAQSSREFQRLERLVRGGLADAAQRTAYESTLSQRASAAAALTSELEAALGSAVAPLPSATRAALARLRIGVAPALPLPYQASSLDEAARVLLRDALAELRRAGADQEEPDAGCRQIVLEAEAEPEVAAAKAALESNLDSVAGAWHTALAE